MSDPPSHPGILGCLLIKLFFKISWNIPLHKGQKHSWPGIIKSLTSDIPGFLAGAGDHSLLFLTVYFLHIEVEKMGFFLG